MNPLFFQSDHGVWLQPIPVYLSWIFGHFAPFVAGSVDIVLIYVAGLQLLKSHRAAANAAAVLMVFPAHATFMQQSTDAIYAVPFVLTWIVCVLAFLDRPRQWMLFAGGLALGVGVYTQPSAPIMMALFVLVGIGALWLEGHHAPRVFAMLLAGFAIPLLLMVPWFAMHPETYPETMGNWAIHKAHIRNPIDGVRAFLNWNTLGGRASRYWEMFNPSFLLFRDEASGFAKPPMLVAAAVLVAIGLKRLFDLNRPSVVFLLLTGLAVSPLAASTFTERHPLGRALPMVVFLSLIAAVGAEHLSASPSAKARGAAVLLVALMLFQFVAG